MSSVISRIMIAPVLLSTLLGASNFAKASSDRSEIRKENIFHDRGDVVTHGKSGFKVNGQKVNSFDLSGDLRGVSSKRDLKNIFATGKALRVSRIGNNYALDTQSRVKGGGPISGYIAYWVTKSLCYGGLAGAAGAGLTAAAAVALPAGTVGTAMAPAIAAYVGAAGTNAAVGAAAGAAMAAPGAALVGTVVAGNAAAATGVALVAGEVATTVAATGGIIASIETASLGAGLFFSGIPFLP